MAPKKKTREEVLERKRELEKMRYQRIKNDNEQRNALKQQKKEYYLKRKAEGKIKNIAELTPRCKRAKRKEWRKNTAKYREKKKNLLANTALFQENTTPPQSDNEVSINDENIIPVVSQELPVLDGRIIEGRRRSEINKRKKNILLQEQGRTINKLKKQLKKQQRIISRMKIQCKKDSPRNKTNEIVKKGDITEIKKRLLFSEVVSKQLSQNYTKLGSHAEKQVFAKAISGDVVKKYKVLSKQHILPEKRERKVQLESKLLNIQRKNRSNKISEDVKMNIINFLEQDCNSRMCAGKKETVTKKKVKKQKRYLLMTMKKLHTIYVKENGNISYSAFCQCRPFWIVKPHVQERNTCLCMIHANFNLLIQSLHQYNIITVHSTEHFLEAVCCDKYNEECTSRKCKNCKDRKIIYGEFDNNIKINVMKWENVCEQVFLKRTGEYKSVKKISKVNHTLNPYDVVKQFENVVPIFLNHHTNIVHQYAAIKKLKDKMSENEVLIHVDFSENYATKYSSEVQAFHFGGSRSQISLHTVVVYWKTNNQLECQSFCTISEFLDHDAYAIWAHLHPIFDWISTNLKPVTNLHFLSDGPVTQYRNRFMFFILANRLKYFYENYTFFSWNYSEAGHGKGAPDGIGAVCKRTADRMVALGEDLVDIKKLQTVLEENCPNIKIITVTQEDYEHSQIKLIGKSPKPYSGTLKVHQVIGNKDSFKLTMKFLSCFCENMFSCQHYLMGTLNYVDNVNAKKSKHNDTSSESENECEIRTPKENIDPNTSSINFDAVEDHVATTSSSNILRKENVTYHNGDYILVKCSSKNTEYRYVAVCMGEVDEEDGEIRVTFLKITGNDGTLFKIDDNCYDLPVEDILLKLPQPSLLLKGERIFYKFPNAVDVFEK